jgi:hypothetical protein
MMADENPQTGTPVEYKPGELKKQMDRIERRVGTLAAQTEKRARKDLEGMKGIKKIRIVYPNGKEEDAEVMEMLVYSIRIKDADGQEAFVQKAQTRKIIVLDRETEEEKK